MQGWQSWDEFFAAHGNDALQALSAGEKASHAEQLRALLEGQLYRQWMLTSCGFFFDDLERIEPINNLRYAARAIKLTELGAPGRDGLRDAFVADLAASQSARTGVTAADLFLREITAAG
jgi:hypothetical protein